MKFKFPLSFLLLFQFLFASSQQQFDANEFKIGMFGVGVGLYKTRMINHCPVPYNTTTDPSGNPTSVLNVLAEDGFNIIQSYDPNEWTKKESLPEMLKCVQANGLQVELGTQNWFKPSVDANGNYIGSGANMYNNCGVTLPACTTPYAQNYFKANYDNLIQTIYSLSPYKDIIWGLHITEEASYYHWWHRANNCQGNTWENPAYFSYTEIPPINTSQALTYFKSAFSSLGINSIRMIVMEANHHRSIRSNTVDHEGIYNPQQYLQLLNANDSRDVFFDGSYSQFSQDNWQNESYSNIFNSGPTNNYHYLAKFKSIDYERTITKNVHSVIAGHVWAYPWTDNSAFYNSTNHSGLVYHFHSNYAIQNANWFWFQTYTSIIHGAKGVWFWDFNSWAPQDNTNRAYFYNEANVDRYKRQYFPSYYQNYISNISRELRYLVNKGLLSTDESTVLYQKLDYDDPNCIVPPPITYLPLQYGSSEVYGLRYTIRTNGNEVIMIISNPLNISVTCELDFNDISNPVIQNSTGAYKLFESNQYAHTSSNYKVNRNSNINLTNNTVGVQALETFNSSTDKAFTLTFGPLDVHILKFNGSVPHYANGWTQVWSNFGNDRIGGHGMHIGDTYFPGDFDGDGVEELLCVCNTGGNTDWISLQKFNNYKWDWVWSNYGSSSANIYPYRDNFIVGDYDGDGKDELLGNDPDGWTTLFKFNNGTWQWVWSDYGGNHAIRPYKDKFYAGDFDGNGKDELLGCDQDPNGWTTMFSWSGNDFTWTWSDNGNGFLNNYRDYMVAGDFDADAKTELLGFAGSWHTLFHYENGNWQWGWSNYGSNGLNGFTVTPFFDIALGGNLDGDIRDECLLIERIPFMGMPAFFASSNDLASNSNSWNTNWTATPSGTDYIDDWPIPGFNGGTDTDYFLMKIKSNEPKYLVAMRKHDCDRHIVSIYKSSPGTNKMGNVEDSMEDVLFDPHVNGQQILLYPNPSNGQITAQFSDRSNFLSYQVYNSTGTIIMDEKIVSGDKTILINFKERGLSSGVYVVNFTTADGYTETHRVVINE